MIRLVPILSDTAPAQRDALWIKPVAGGFTMYMMDGGVWRAFKSTEEKEAPKAPEIDVKAIVGKTQDSKSKNTIYGAKNYAKDQAENLRGSASDTSADLTLYGLKAYIDEKTAG